MEQLLSVKRCATSKKKYCWGSRVHRGGAVGIPAVQKDSLSCQPTGPCWLLLVLLLLLPLVLPPPPLLPVPEGWANGDAIGMLSWNRL